VTALRKAVALLRAGQPSLTACAVVFITYVLHSLTHHFSGVESWVNEHRTVIERATGWHVGAKDATDDRLGRLSEVLGENDEAISECQLRIGQSIISAYQLPTEIARYDTMLQALTLMEFVARSELAKKDESISGLVPGNPKMKTKRPTAEQLLSQFGTPWHCRDKAQGMHHGSPRPGSASRSGCRGSA
jgi:hypothetical protein